MSRFHKLLAPACGACLMLGLAITPTAQAAQIDSGTETDSWDFVDPNFCDVPGLEVQVVGSLQVRYRAHPQGPERVAYYVQQTTISNRYTNVTDGATGPYVDESVRTTEKDQEIVADGNLITITVLATGMAKVKNAQGRVISANPGQIRYQVLIDDNGTPADPLDDTFIEDLGIVRDSTGRNDDFCADVVPALTS